MDTLAWRQCSGTGRGNDPRVADNMERKGERCVKNQAAWTGLVVSRRLGKAGVDDRRGGNRNVGG